MTPNSRSEKRKGKYEWVLYCEWGALPTKKRAQEQGAYHNDVNSCYGTHRVIRRKRVNRRKS